MHEEWRHARAHSTIAVAVVLVLLLQIKTCFACALESKQLDVDHAGFSGSLELHSWNACSRIIVWRPHSCRAHSCGAQEVSSLLTGSYVWKIGRAGHEMIKYTLIAISRITVSLCFQGWVIHQQRIGQEHTAFLQSDAVATIFGGLNTFKLFDAPSHDVWVEHTIARFKG